MKTYKAGELREDMLVVPVHALEAERQELARLRADSAELARVRETVEIDMPYTLVNVPDSNENRVIGFRISKSDEAYGEMGLSEPLAWFRKWVGQIASSKGRRIPEGFALVPVEVKLDAERYQWLCKQAAEDSGSVFMDRAISQLSEWVTPKHEIDSTIDAAPKGDSHE